MKNSIFMSFLSALALCSFFMSGCDSARPKNKEQQNQPVVQEAPPQEERPPKQEEPPNVPETIDVKAEVGVGTKGRYGTPTGNNPMEIITVPISAMFRTRDRLFFQQVDYAMNLYKAEHDGNGPATHEEFMEKIIRANLLTEQYNRFPLPPNQSFVYDPKDGELKVRKPKDAQ